jgi:FkbM family methyltransferase
VIRQLLRRIWDRLDVRGRRLRALANRVGKLEDALRTRRAESEAQRAEWQRDRLDLKRRIAFYHRRVPDPDVVRELLPLRALTIGARAAHVNAVAADARLQDLSTAYRDALADAARPRPDLTVTTLQGLTWWVPVPAALRGGARDRFIAKQRFPYRNITQTREFATGPILLDIGANIGRMSIPRVILGDFERAYCAEPDPLNFAALVRNVASNGLRGLVLPGQMAIGATTGSVQLTQSKYPGGHRLTGPDRQDQGAIEVPCWTVDEWCRRFSIQPDLVTYVKVDTQGWEVHVLRGASNLLERRHIAWQLEVTPHLLAAAGTSAGILYDLCADRFTHFVDLGKRVQGQRVRPASELAQALDYLVDEAATDIVLFNAA